MKKFIEKKVTDWKFKKAGEGHSLSEERNRPSQPSTSSQPASRVVPSTSSESAGSAALARLEAHERRGQPSRPQGGGPGTRGRSLVGSEATRGGGAGNVVKKKPCAGFPDREEPIPMEPEVVDVASRNIIVHMICPVCQLSVPNADSSPHLLDCLQKEVEKEPLSGAVKTIYTLCRDQEKRTLCVDTIAKYLSNIIAHPGEEKYCKIRVQNKAFQERVADVHGALLFLEVIGFKKQRLPHQDGEEEFLVLPKEEADLVANFETYRELLTSGQALALKLDRNLQVFKPSFQATNFNLPDSFFNLTVEEIRREQKLKSEMVEREGVLRTKIMREMDEVKMAVRHYGFVLLRVRLPDGYILQGVFRPLEKLRDVRAFVSEALSNQSHVFSLSCVGKTFADENMSLAAFGLVPSAVLNFSWDSSCGPTPDPPCLNSDLLARAQDIL